LISVHQPPPGLVTSSSWHDVQELTPLDIDDRGRELRHSIGAVSDEGHLIETEGGDFIEASGVLDEYFAVGEDRVVDRVPVATELSSHLSDAAPVSAHLQRDPAASPIGQLEPGCSDASIDLGPASPPAVEI